MTALFGNSGVIASAGIASGVAVASLEFDGSTDSLQMSNTNFGSYTRTKFAIAGSIYPDAFGGRVITSKGDSAGTREWYISGGGTGSINFDNSTCAFNSSNGVLSTGAWNSFLIYYDSANATSGDRIKIWVNNAAITPSFYLAPSAAVPTTTDPMMVGAQLSSGSPATRYDGLIYQFTFFDNVLPSTTDVFDGSAGKLKDLSLIAGAKSLLDGVTAVSDFFLATDWTNNGSVTTNASKP